MREYTPCVAGQWTRIYSGPSVGFICVWTPWGEQQIRYRALTLNVPFSVERAATVGVKTVIWFGLPTFWVEFSVMPAQDAFFAATL